MTDTDAVQNSSMLTEVMFSCKQQKGPEYPIFESASRARFGLVTRAAFASS